MEFREFNESRADLAKTFKSKLHGIPQDPNHHPEGDVLRHTRLVRKSIPGAIRELKQFQMGEGSQILQGFDFDNISPYEKEILAISAWIHDIGKVSATTIGDNHWSDGGDGRIRAIGHEDKKHFEPQLRDLEKVSPPSTVKFYMDNKDTIDWIVENHMSFTGGGGFSKRFIAQNFENGIAKPTPRMKLLLILMWADKMGTLPGEKMINSLKNNRDSLVRSSQKSLKSRHTPQSSSFQGGVEDFVNMLKSRNVDLSNRIKAVKAKFPELSELEVRQLSENESSGPTTLNANIPVPEDVLVIGDALRHEGGDVKLYAVGGFVRDFLFHQFNNLPGKFSPKDVDLTTNLSEEEILERLRTPYAASLGIKVNEKESVDTFGVVFVSVNGNEAIEVAPFRRDVGSADGRRPERVEMAGVEDDAMRRDLTINNLYYDFYNKKIYDFNKNGQGISDIKNGITRPVGDPRERFDEDKLRVLRLVRFFSRFNTGQATKVLDEETLSAIDEYRDVRSYGITSERIVQEFLAGIKQSRNTVSFLKNYIELGLMESVFPGLHLSVGDIERIGNSKNPIVVIAWLLKGNPSVAQALNQLKYPNSISSAVQLLIDSISVDRDGLYKFYKALEKGGERIRNDLKEFAALAGNPPKLIHLVNYKMDIPGGEELMQRGLKGKAIGDEQRRSGIAHYDQSFKSFIN